MALKSAPMIEVPAGVIEGVVISENSAVSHEGVVVEGDVAVIPVRSPVVPAPAKATEETDAKPEAKVNSRAGEVESGIRIPTGPDVDGLSIYQPRIILRHVNDLRVRWFDHNGLSLLR